MKTDTLSQAFFESKYRNDPDPWNFASSAYELGRYQATLEALADRQYRRAFEPGCSIGILTARLAAVCGQVEALDISPTAVESARKRCKAFPNVNIVCGALPEFIPGGRFDLIVFSEIGYYFDERQLQELGQTLVKQLLNPGTLLAAHWLGESADHVLTGDRVHELLGALDGLRHVHSERHSGFRLDRWERA